MNPKGYEADAEKIKELVSTYKYYEIFGVDEKASQRELDNATIAFLKKYPMRTYPDIFELVSPVMSVLKNDRKKYDKKRYFIKVFDELFKGEKNYNIEKDLAEKLEIIIKDDLESLKIKGNKYILQQIKEKGLCLFYNLEVSTVDSVKNFTLDSRSFSFNVPEDIQNGDLVLASDGGHGYAIVTVKIKTLGFVDVVLDISSIDVYLDDEFKGKLPCTIGATPGEHIITIKQGTNAIGSQTVNFIPREKEKHSISLSIPEPITEYVSKGNNGTSSNTLALLTLLGIASSPFAMEGVEGFFLFSFFFIGFIGVFYKKKWGSILAMLSGLIAFISSNPPIMFLLGIIVIYLGWREYSALKTS